MSKLFVHPITPLLLFSLALTALMIAYVIGGAAPSEAFDIFVSWVWSILAALWVVADARRRDAIPCYDFGLFCYLFFPCSSRVLLLVAGMAWIGGVVCCRRYLDGAVHRCGRDCGGFVRVTFFSAENASVSMLRENVACCRDSCRAGNRQSALRTSSQCQAGAKRIRTAGWPLARGYCA
jgi:hypothetical protein